MWIDYLIIFAVAVIVLLMLIGCLWGSYWIIRSVVTDFRNILEDMRYIKTMKNAGGFSPWTGEMKRSLRRRFNKRFPFK